LHSGPLGSLRARKANSFSPHRAAGPMPSSVKVCIRTRPTANFAQDQIVVDGNQLAVKMPKSDNPNAQDSWSWKYDAVLHNASQDTVYNEQASPIVQSVLRGYNGTIMCYGQTGAGKTFTQVGSLESYQNRGITPRAIGEIFHYISDHPQFEATVAVTYVEIHNDTLVDLLSTLPAEVQTDESLHIVEDRKGETSVKGLRSVPVASEQEALSMLFEGMNNRQVANHQLNRNSTRGHAIFTIHTRIRSRVDSSGVVTKCKLNLVDLAGSERLKKTDTMGDLRAESMYINKSLSYLEQVVVALAAKGRSHTPYRQSKLTHLLKDSLGGNCKTLLVANVYGETTHLEETISTLQFAARVRLVPNEATINQDYDAEQLLKRYAIEIQDLKRELAMHDSLASRSRVAYEPYSDSQRSDLMAQLQSFLDAEGGDEMQIESVRQMRELLSAMKSLYTKQGKELEHTKAILATGGGGAGYLGGEGGGEGGGEAADAECVGEADASGTRGIAVGAAPDGARPSGGLMEPPSSLGAGADMGDGELGATAVLGDSEDRTLGRDEAFAQYKTSEGLATNERLVKAKKELRKAKAERSRNASIVNEAKKGIDRVKLRLNAKKVEREAAAMSPEDAEIIDEEEYAFIQESKEAKRAYKDAHGAMTQATRDCETFAADAESARSELLSTFNEWYAMNFNEPAIEGSTTGGAALTRSAVPTEPEAAAPGDVMDDDEQFEMLQLARVMAEAPDSLAFVNARKSMRAKPKIKM